MDWLPWRKMSITKAGLILLVVAGIVFSVWDWHNWRREELKNYGQGRVEGRL